MVLMLLAAATVAVLGIWVDVDALALVALAGTVVGGCVALSQKLIEPDPPAPEKKPNMVELTEEGLLTLAGRPPDPQSRQHQRQREGETDPDGGAAS